MGLYKEGEDYVSYVEPETSSTVVKERAACFASVVASIAGGFLLGWWEYQYHSTYSQLWMVPFGLILFVTPVIVWFSVFVSHICSSDPQMVIDNVDMMITPVSLLSNSVPAKKNDKWSDRVDHV